MLDGSTLGAFLLTEPGVGSDATAITTTAIANGNGWVLNGEKAWVTNATDAGLLSVYAQTDPGSGAKGIAAFLVRADQPGVIREDAYEMLGAHATGTGGFCFDRVNLDADQLFVPPGHAFRAAIEAIDLARIVVSAMCAGMLRRGLETAVDYLKNRQAFGAPLSERQGLQWMLADVATNLEASTALTRTAATALDEGDPTVGVCAAHAKKFATRVTLRWAFTVHASPRGQRLSPRSSTGSAFGLRQDGTISRWHNGNSECGHRSIALWSLRSISGRADALLTPAWPPLIHCMSWSCFTVNKFIHTAFLTRSDDAGYCLSYLFL